MIITFISSGLFYLSLIIVVQFVRDLMDRQVLNKGELMKEYLKVWNDMTYVQKTVIAFISIGIIYAMGEVRLFPW